MTGLCKDCQYWDKRLESKVGMCDLTWSPNPEFPADDPLRQSKARVSLSGHNQQVLETDADFGCVQFEKRG